MTIDDSIVEANNLAIDTEYNAAIGGIEKRFSQLKEELGDDIVMTQVLDKVEASLKKNIIRVVTPVTIAQMEQRNTILRDRTNDAEEHIDTELEKDVDLLNEELDDSDSETEEFDEEALKDEEAYERVRALRKEVREASERLFKISENVSQKAVKLAKKGITGQGECNDVASDQEEIDDELQGDEHDLDERHDNVVAMVQNLRQLTEKLNDVTLEMPQAISKLEKTIENIEKDVNRRPESLSQTEIAILSQNNEGVETKNIANINDPDEKFACFMELTS
eukprot:CAMPEP_0194224822 /NCGR_PEP_ID=MMETSP0156-20130528/38241_1 /TAXON_ID=33649 /ORGANISM="Thalassionema nitzschioides, Strain L26-B" /LENGTH=278 /DNA_ID=CAMNT_0038956535 /DNA_START=69 /DNA_END=905 /DNA_ORIENTATION=+